MNNFIWLGLLAYGVVGGVAFQLWNRRLQRRLMHVPAPSNAWLRPLVPHLLIAVEVYALGGALLACVLLLLTTPIFATSYDILGFAGSLVFMSVVFAVIDVFAIRWSRRAAAAHQD
jgi:hypothetical protein